MEFKNICRVCLEEKSGLNSLFEASVAKMLMACDGLPDKICKQCTIMASRAYRFKELCEKSDTTLREYLSSTKLTTEIADMRPELLLTDNNSLGGPCSLFSDIFVKNDALTDPLLLESTNLSTAFDCNIQNITDQCLPTLWNQSSFYDNTLQTIDKQQKDDWNLDIDIDSSTYTKSYIDLDHSSRIINEDRLSKKQNGSFNCQICGKIFLDAKNFKKHCHVDDNFSLDKKHMCNVCGKRYKENKLLIIHMRTHTGERPYKCEICSKSFALSSSLHKHRVLHTGQKKHKCPICEKSFYQKSNFNNHMRIHTGHKPFICPICGKNYTTKIYLERHSLSHSGLKPYNCVICDSSFRTRAQLKRHEIKHSGEKKYECTHCGQTFALKETRDTHMRYHTNERPYKCTLCPKQYIASSHLRRHMLSHTNERRHQCTICHKLFMQRRHLTSHMHTHTGQRPYSCMICGKCFAHSGTLSTHLKIHKKDC